MLSCFFGILSNENRGGVWKERIIRRYVINNRYTIFYTKMFFIGEKTGRFYKGNMHSFLVI